MVWKYAAMALVSGPSEDWSSGFAASGRHKKQIQACSRRRVAQKLQSHAAGPAGCPVHFLKRTAALANILT
jgi:hypothetical protein